MVLFDDVGRIVAHLVVRPAIRQGERGVEALFGQVGGLDDDSPVTSGGPGSSVLPAT
ncbi:hypothetical protein [Streptomyces sp. NPDC055058]